MEGACAIGLRAPSSPPACSSVFRRRSRRGHGPTICSQGTRALLCGGELGSPPGARHAKCIGLCPPRQTGARCAAQVEVGEYAFWCHDASDVGASDADEHPWAGSFESHSHAYKHSVGGLEGGSRCRGGQLPGGRPRRRELRHANTDEAVVGTRHLVDLAQRRRRIRLHNRPCFGRGRGSSTCCGRSVETGIGKYRDTQAATIADTRTRRRGFI